MKPVTLTQSVVEESSVLAFAFKAQDGVSIRIVTVIEDDATPSEVSVLLNKFSEECAAAVRRNA